MSKFYLHLVGCGEGCGCIIGCNNRLMPLDGATTLSEAESLVPKALGEFGISRIIETATILQVENEQMFDMIDYYSARWEADEAEKKRLQDLQDEVEYARLWKKFHKEGK